MRGIYPDDLSPGPQRICFAPAGNRSLPSSHVVKAGVHRHDRLRCRRRRHAEDKGAGRLVARLSGTGRLADDLYLLAHHEITGKPHLQPRAVGLGLAGALLAELMLSGNDLPPA